MKEYRLTLVIERSRAEDAYVDTMHAGKLLAAAGLLARDMETPPPIVEDEAMPGMYVNITEFRQYEQIGHGG